MTINDENMQRLMRLHNEFKRIRFSEVHKNFSNSEFFTLCRICGVATDFDRAKNPVGIGVPMKLLSDGLRVTPAMTSKTINTLENRGCVERKYDGTDRRSVKVCITEKGAALWEEDDRLGREFAEEIFKKFGDKKIVEFFSLAEELLEIAAAEAQKSKERTKKG